jgi:hypothetical protein
MVLAEGGLLLDDQVQMWYNLSTLELVFGNSRHWQ